MPCPKHDTAENPATHLWKDCFIMQEFMKQTKYDHEPPADQAPVFKVRVIKVADPGQDTTAVTATTMATISISITSSMVRADTTTKEINSVSNSSNPDIRIIRRS